MLPKIHRLTKKKDFDLVFKKGKSARQGFLVCKAVGNNLAESRFGFVVSKKISTKATIRNKVRRRLQNTILTQLKNIQTSVDVVMVVLPGIEKKEFLEIQKGVSDCLKKLKLYV